MGFFAKNIVFFLSIIIVMGLATQCKDKSYPCPSYTGEPTKVDTSKGKGFLKGFMKKTNPETGLLDNGGRRKKLDKELKKIRKRKQKRLRRNQ